MQKEKLNKKNKGITLIALIITIIVMLILVGVSITVSLNGGLFNTAEKARDNTIEERDRELGLSDGKVEINGKEYDSIDEYVNGSNTNEPTDEPTNTPVEYTAYSIGDVVTIGTESFYVMEASDSSNPNVKLLAKDCINTSTLVQSASAGTVTFSTEKYWGSITGDIVEPEPTLDEVTGKLTLPASHLAAKAAYDYGAKLGGTGRLMTRSEVIALETANSDILYGTNGKSSIPYLKYWVGYAYGASSVWYVWGEISYYGVTSFSEFNEVRPVVEILKSNI